MNKNLIFLAFGCFCIGVVSTVARQSRGVHQDRASEDSACEINLPDLLKYDNIVPVLIIGSGPAGLAAALHATRDNKSPVIVTGDRPGGLLTTTGDVENWLGITKKTGQEAMDDAAQHASNYGASFLRDSVVSVDFNQRPFRVQMGSGIVVHALAIVIATGATPKTLNIPGEQESWGEGLSTCAKCDAWFFKGQKVAVVGGGESAIEEAIQLSQHAQEVTILVRGSRMRATAYSQERLKNYQNITIRYATTVQQIVKAPTGGIRYLVIRNMHTGLEEHLDVKGLFLAIGHTPNSALFKEALELDSEGYIVLKGRTQETSLAGVFAAGDVADSVYRQVTYAAGAGDAAGIDACRYLDVVGFTPRVAQGIAESPKQEQLRGLLSHKGW